MVRFLRTPLNFREITDKHDIPCTQWRSPAGTVHRVTEEEHLHYHSQKHSHIRIVVETATGEQLFLRYNLLRYNGSIQQN